MKKRKLFLTFLLAILAGLLVGCTAVGTSTSWPGLAANEKQLVISYGPQLYAVDAINGSRLWSFPPEKSNAVAFYAPAALNDDLLVVGDYSHTLYGVGLANGIARWTFDAAKDKYVGGALIEQDRVYAPNADHYLYALDLNGVLQWRFKTQQTNWSTPVTDGEKLYFASMDHFLYALNLDYPVSALTTDAEGARTLVVDPVWSVDLRAAMVTSPTLTTDGQLLIAANLAGEVFAVSTKDGAIQWKYNGEGKLGSIWTKPLIIADAVFLADDQGNIFALDVISGKALWPAAFEAGSTIIGAAVAVDDYAAFPTQAGKVIFINTEKQTQPALTIAGELITQPIFQNGKLFLAVVSKEKLLVALDENGREFWTFKPE